MSVSVNKDAVAALKDARQILTRGFNRTGSCGTGGGSCLPCSTSWMPGHSKAQALLREITGYDSMCSFNDMRSTKKAGVLLLLDSAIGIEQAGGL